MKLSVNGTISHIGETRTFGSSNYPVKEIVLKTKKEVLMVEFGGDDGMEMADRLSVGHTVQLTCWLSCREWKKDSSTPAKYFYSLKAREIISNQPPQSQGELQVGGESMNGDKSIVVGKKYKKSPVPVSDADIPF